MWDTVNEICDCFRREAEPTRQFKDKKAVRSAMFRSNTFNLQELKARVAAECKQAAEAKDGGSPISASKQRSALDDEGSQEKGATCGADHDDVAATKRYRNEGVAGCGGADAGYGAKRCGRGVWAAGGGGGGIWTADGGGGGGGG